MPGHTLMDNMSAHFVRRARPSDYDRIAAVADDWWGRPILMALPRLFLDHFHRTSLVADNSAVGSGFASGADDQDGLSGFLVGIISPSELDQAYIHVVGVHPLARGIGLARNLYDQFFSIARANERQVVRAITAPVNENSIRFHRRLGFTVSDPVVDYNGPGRDFVVFERRLP